MNKEYIKGDTVKLARESRGLTQMQLAKRIGITQSNLSKIESEFKNNLSSKIVKRLSTVLNYPKSFFSQTIERHRAISY
jgi:transcriptional regulator with XRE-family HTH domain